MRIPVGDNFTQQHLFRRKVCVLMTIITTHGRIMFYLDILRRESTAGREARELLLN